MYGKESEKIMLYKAKSSIEGLGLFTDVPISKGEIIGEFSIVPATYQTKFSIWIDDEMFRAKGILKYSNHSPNPNVKVDFPEMITLRNIKAGEELVWDYGEEFEETPSEQIDRYYKEFKLATENYEIRKLEIKLKRIIDSHKNKTPDVFTQENKEYMINKLLELLE